MKRTSFLCALVAGAMLVPAVSFGQSAAGSTSRAGGSGGASSNPLLGGTGTYGSAAQGSTTGGGAYTLPNANIAAINETFRRLDRNGDSVLSMEEFHAAYAKPVGGGSSTSAKKSRRTSR